MKEILSPGQRRSIRIPGFDYADTDSYFVTIVSYKRLNLFGDIRNGIVILNQMGKVVTDTWLDIPIHFPKVSNEVFIVMPNHVHGILTISNDTVGATHESPLLQRQAKGPPPGSLGATIESFKSSVMRKIHQSWISSPEKIWQRNYYEHIIRDEEDYQNKVEYILTNPINWEIDKEYSPS